MDINDVLRREIINNYNYYKKYKKNFKNMLNNSLVDKENTVASIIRYVSKGEDKYLLTEIFYNCNSDYKGITEILVLKYKEYFPTEIIELVENRLNSWDIPYEEYIINN